MHTTTIHPPTHHPHPGRIRLMAVAAGLVTIAGAATAAVVTRSDGPPSASTVVVEAPPTRAYTNEDLAGDMVQSTERTPIEELAPLNQAYTYEDLAGTMVEMVGGTTGLPVRKPAG